MPEEPPQRHEDRDVSVRYVVFFAAGLILFLVIAGVALWPFYGGAMHMPGAIGPVTRQPAPGPVLQIAPKEELEAFQQRERRQLHTFGWVDRDSGIARIPIDEAMRIIAERGLPNWGEQTLPTGDACELLLRNVPRSPQARRCLARLREPQGSGAVDGGNR